MQPTANTNRFLTGWSSSLGLADSEIVVSRDGLRRHIVVGHLAQYDHSRKLFGKLTDSLIQSAEQAYIVRNVPALEEVSQILMNLPVDAARQIGTYYHALAINRKGQRDEAETLLGKVADDGPLTFRARAIQTLGGNLHDKGQLREALRLQLEALKVASDKNVRGLQTMLKAHFEIAIVRSLDGDHKRALSDLEGLWPVVYHFAKQNPFYFYLFHNELAVELGEVGRLNEAQAACAIALASPFAPAYPEWSETRDEIAAKRTSASPSVVAVLQVPEAERAREPNLATRVATQRQREPFSALAFCSPASNKDFFQRSIIPIPAAKIALTVISILDRVLACIGPRAPPSLSRHTNI